MTRGMHRARSLGAALRDVRERATISQRKVAAQLGISHTTVGRWEAGEITPSLEDVAAFLAVVGVTGNERDRILNIARVGDESDLLISGSPGVNPHLSAFLAYEQNAVRITEYAPLLVPGLLQSPDYGRAVVSQLGGTMPTSELTSRLNIRMGRQSILTRLEPVELVAIIDVGVLRANIGGPRVMAAQLEHLASLAKRGNVTLQAHDLHAKTECTPAHTGPFAIFEFADLDPVVYLEHLSSGAFLEDPEDVSVYQTAAKTIRRAAMSPADTLELIAEVIPRMETTR